MRKTALAMALALALGRAVFPQNATAPVGVTPQPPATEPGPDVPSGLGELAKRTFACPKAALNAAAREVETYPSLGTYQFSYFNIVTASHHAEYEVHFTSNYAAEPVLKFCVALYCQQGFDPASTTRVTLMGANATRRAAPGGHTADDCSPKRAPGRRRTAR